jgi:predicted ATPase
MAQDLAGHDDAIRAAVETVGGSVFKTTGDGVCAVFSTATAAVRAAVAAQLSVALPVRMGIHSGEAQRRAGDYFGPTLNRCARLMDTAHAGQIVVSSATAALIGDALGEDLGLVDLGEHRLRDLQQPEHIFQLVAPGVRETFPPLRSLDAVRHNLPVQRSSFVGREPQLILVSELLVGSRLVTLTGVGGCGKTRLALEIAARDAEHYPDGVFFVDLAPVADPGLLTQTVSSALGLHLVSTEPADLATYLVGRATLIVLDNCEHLVDACAELVDVMLRAGTEVKVLATSREALGVDGEQAFTVPSLDVDTEAPSLFISRASVARPALVMSADLEQTAREICRRLDGIPLAIELAAARASHLAPTEILERLSDRFRLLTGGRRRVQRQQTLQAAIDWSYDLLSDDEKILLRRLAVFSGSFSLSAAEAICHPDALDLLGSLVAKSLVALAPDAHATRYRLLETVRIYAEDKLFDAGEADSTRTVHRDWYLAWIESIPVDEIVWAGEGEDEYLVADADNLQSALEWSQQENRVDLVARMASRMIGYWFYFARVADLAAWADYLLAATTDADDELRATAFATAAYHAMAAGDFVTMEAHSATAVKLAEPTSWICAVAWSLQVLYWTIADPERGTRYAEAGARAAVAAATPGIGAIITTFASQLAIMNDDYQEAANILETASNAYRRSERLQGHSRVVVLTLLGDVREATRAFDAITIGHSPLNHHMHEFTAAIVALSDRRRDDAIRHLVAAARIVRDHALPLADIDCILGFAGLAAIDGDYQHASRLLATARAAGPFPFRTGSSVAVYRTYVRVARDHVDHSTLERCRAEGANQRVTTALDAELAHVTRDQ